MPDHALSEATAVCEMPGLACLIQRDDAPGSAVEAVIVQCLMFVKRIGRVRRHKQL
jgi:hypothetical protein